MQHGSGRHRAGSAGSGTDAAPTAVNDALPDIVAHRLEVLFCGINPGLTAVAAGHHFVSRSNRFWRVLHLAGFTPEEIPPRQDRSILAHGYGLTTVVRRPTASAGQLAREEFAAAAAGFARKLERHAPRFVAFLGKAAYAELAARREIAWGAQPERMHGAAVWVLPNPSGRNRAFTLAQLVEAYRPLRQAVAAAARD